MTSPRERIVAAAAALLAEGGREAVTTRAISAAAGVQDPAIYRIFGDKRNLLDAVATHGMELYLQQKAAAQPTGDPVADLERGWDVHVEFGLANPALYALIYGEPRPSRPSPAAEALNQVLRNHIHRIAAAGRLRVSEDDAVRLVHAAGSGATFTLLSLAEDQRDVAVSRMARDAVIAAITTDGPAPHRTGPAAAATALRAQLDDITALTAPEKTLLAEWLDRTTHHHQGD